MSQGALDMPSPCDKCIPSEACHMLHIPGYPRPCQAPQQGQQLQAAWPGPQPGNTVLVPLRAKKGRRDPDPLPAMTCLLRQFRDHGRGYSSNVREGGLIC